MDKLVKTGQIDQRFFWWLVNQKRKKMVSPIYSDDGKLLTQPDQIRHEWTEYFRNLFAERVDPWDSNFRMEVDEFVGNVNDSHDNFIPGLNSSSLGQNFKIMFQKNE